MQSNLTFGHVISCTFVLKGKTMLYRIKQTLQTLSVWSLNVWEKVWQQLKAWHLVICCSSILF